MTNRRSVRVWLAGLTIATALALSGCLQQSVSPLFTLEESSFDDRLLGMWTCGDEQWTFSREIETELPAKPYYRVTIEVGDRRGTLGAILGQLGKHAFLTFVPGDADSKHEPATPFVGRHMMGASTFGRLSLDQTRLRLAMLGTHWIEQAYRAGLLPFGVNQRWGGANETDLNVILTGPPADLQRFARVYAEDAAVFSEKIELIRATPAGSPPESGTCYAER